eukprot:5904033-Alexandrium_andersonii.AAC.1
MSWKITEPQVKCDMVDLDAEVQHFAHPILPGGLYLFMSAVTRPMRKLPPVKTCLRIARAFARFRPARV